MKSDHDQFHPTLMFGFQLDALTKEQVLCQMWVNPAGLVEYRPVPMLDADKAKTVCTTGYLEDDDDGSAG